MTELDELTRVLTDRKELKERTERLLHPAANPYALVEQEHKRYFVKQTKDSKKSKK